MNDDTAQLPVYEPPTLTVLGTLHKLTLTRRP